MGVGACVCRQVAAHAAPRRRPTAAAAADLNNILRNPLQKRAEHLGENLSQDAAEVVWICPTDAAKIFPRYLWEWFSRRHQRTLSIVSVDLSINPPSKPPKAFPIYCTTILAEVNK